MKYFVVTVLVFCFIYNVQGQRDQKFPCSFNSYEKVKDGRITSNEYLLFTSKYGIKRDLAEKVFTIMDTDGNSQIEVSEFVDSMAELRHLNLLGRCTRDGIKITLTVEWG